MIDTFFVEVGSERDVLAERDFYRRHFGMWLVGDDPAREDDDVFLTNGQTTIGFLYGDRPTPAVTINFGMTVDDLDAEVARLEGEGVRFSVGPEQQSWGRVAAFTDPVGFGVWLIERATFKKVPAAD